jgi:Cu+-exporting ATPase
MATNTAEDEPVLYIRLLLGEIYEENHEILSNKFCENINGVFSCRFLGKTNELIISFNRNILDQYKLVSLIEEMGYSVELIDCEIVQTQLRIEGMHCNSCVVNICDSILDLPGAIDIQLTFLNKLATIIYDPTILHLDNIITEIEKLSFQVAISSAPQIKSTNSST